MKISLLGYPAGASGMALILMRLSISGVLAFISVGCDSASSTVSIASAFLACLIAGGLYTRLASSLFAIAGLVSIVLGEVSFTYAPLAVQGVAVALLGPGAWSIDAFNLRRGTLTLPDDPPHGR